MYRHRRSAALLLLLVIAASAMCVPARRNVIAIQQPDGSTLHLRTAGDEFSHYLLTTDDVMVAKADDNSIRYVTSIGPSGTVLMSDMAHDATSRSASEKVLLSQIDQSELVEAYSEKRTAAPGEYSVSTIRPFGEMRSLVLLVEFPDKPFTKDSGPIRQTFNDMLNRHGYRDTVFYNGELISFQGSARDYFEAQSYGQFLPQFDVIGPIMADSSYAYYGKGTNDYVTTSRLMDEVCRKAYKQHLFNPADYDSNMDGEADFIFMVYAGRGENYSGSDPNTIWPHIYYFNSEFEGIRFSRYACTCEVFFDSEDIIDGIGTFCHEFAHIIGLPDFYDVTSGRVFALNSWSIMDYGQYDNYDFSPAGMTAFERFSIGWMDIITLDSPGRFSLEDIGHTGIAYRLNTDDPDKFLILENHDRTGWFSYQASAGLMVTAVSYNKALWQSNHINTNSRNRHYYILPADNVYDSGTLSGDLFPYNGNDSLTVWSKPASMTSEGYYTELPVYDITYVNGVSSFTIPSPTAVTTAATESAVMEIRTAGGITDYSKPAGGHAGQPAGIRIVRAGDKVSKVLVP